MSTVEGKKQEKRRALLDAAYELFLERGTSKTSVEDITSRAKVGKGTFYLYFADKGSVTQALLARVSYQLLDDACAAAEQHAAERREIADLLDLDDASFRQVFSGSPIKRVGRDRMVRNAAVAAGNSGDVRLAEPLARLLDDPAPAVRGAAAWALGRLDPARWAAERSRRLAQEPDAEVRAEWAEAP